MAKISKEEYELLKSLRDSWRWIARDEDGDLYAYDVKPERLRYMWFYEFGDAIRLAKHEHLFQFIQWEDEEPYNIAELIEDHEKESEETEMPKINQEEYELLKSLRDSWRWIARDSNTSLWVYEKEPRKHEDFWDDLSGVCESVDSDSFQFIQWEDSEPYNIAELIERYEDEREVRGTDIFFKVPDKPQTPPIEGVESEESEVKKDKKWLIDKLTKERNETDVHNPAYQYLSEFIKEVNQLDEPEVTLDRAFDKVAESYSITKEKIWRHLERLEAHGGKVTYGEQEVLSQDWIDDNTWNNHYVGKPFVYVEDLKNLLVPKQEETNDDLYILKVGGGYMTDFELTGGRVSNFSIESEYGEDVVKASKPFMEFVQKQVGGELYNITNPEEQKYYVLDKDNIIMIGKANSGKVMKRNFHTPFNNFNESAKEKAQLTEQEIKDYDPRFWPFAIKVEELEE